MRRSEILPLPTASWIGWCTRLTGSSCKENRCAKNEAAKTARNDKSEESCGNGGAVGSVENQKQVSHSSTAISYARKPNGKQAGFASRPARRRFAPAASEADREQ